MNHRDVPAIAAMAVVARREVDVIVDRASVAASVVPIEATGPIVPKVAAELRRVPNVVARARSKTTPQVVRQPPNRRLRPKKPAARNGRHDVGEMADAREAKEFPPREPNDVRREKPMNS